ncbi:hypothetical protein ACTVZO_42885 [Streptomyces sp. IBSNAI002]|uniref:hypothetical protein n=1 Tax=Streptomyces sp. IBSNAI002 TaxID=3457500 RepID=UPI003FD39C9B
MRYTRTALTITTTLLALTALGNTAHADSKNKDGKSNSCYIKVVGNHNHDACGNIEYGNNATTGAGHQVFTGDTRLRDAAYNCFEIANHTGDTFMLDAANTDPGDGNSWYGGLPQSPIPAEDTFFTAGCTNGPNQFALATIAYSNGSGKFQGSIADNSTGGDPVVRGATTGYDICLTGAYVASAAQLTIDVYPKGQGNGTNCIHG